MPNSLTARNFDLNAEVKQYVESKVDRLRKVFGHIQKIDVILSNEKHLGMADLVVEATQARLKCTAKDSTPLAAFDIAMDKMERQLVRHKGKLTGNKKHNKEIARRVHALIEPAGEAPEPLPDVELAEEETAAAHTIRPRVMTHLEAADSFERSGYELLVYLDEEKFKPHILHRDDNGHTHLFEVAIEPQ